MTSRSCLANDVGKQAGDGVTDLAGVCNNGAYDSVALRESTGTTFTTVSSINQVGGWPPSSAWFVGTFNIDLPGNVTPGLCCAALGPSSRVDGSRAQGSSSRLVCVW